MTAYRLGVDIGGTFTDIVVLAPDGTIYSKKVPSTPGDYSLAIEGDVLELGRFRSPRLYDLRFRKPEPLVERRLRFEVDERMGPVSFGSR